MKYYEILDPYYALIEAQNQEEAVQEYIDVVAGDQEDFDTLMKEVKEVPEYYASVKLSRGKGEKGELIDLEEVLEVLKKDEKQVLLTDGSLI